MRLSIYGKAEKELLDLAKKLDCNPSMVVVLLLMSNREAHLSEEAKEFLDEEKSQGRDRL